VLAGERIMGFGHPVYRTEDPRSALLKRVALSFGGPRVEFAVQVEERVPVLLERLKPGRQLHTNLEWYAAIVMELVGLDRSLFTPTFAAARVLGWTANVLEQAADPKIIRPSARYVGPPAPQPVPPRQP
jgi:citrate synthase